MPVREKGRRSPGSPPARPFSRPQPPADRRQNAGFSVTASKLTAETDWLLEEAGFEPSVPRDTNQVRRGSHHLGWIDRRRKIRRECEPTRRRRPAPSAVPPRFECRATAFSQRRRSAWRIDTQGDRGFESPFLYRRVGSELASRQIMTRARDDPVPHPPHNFEIASRIGGTAPLADYALRQTVASHGCLCRGSPGGR